MFIFYRLQLIYTQFHQVGINYNTGLFHKIKSQNSVNLQTIIHISYFNLKFINRCSI